LDAILSCTDNQLIKDVFETDQATALLLNEVSRSLTKHTPPNPEDLLLMSKGFETHFVDNEVLTIIPTSYHAGGQKRATSVSNIPFCHDQPAAHYKNSSGKLGPYMIEIDGKNWQLNPSEIFAHADQFEFRSGVFSDSSSIFFIAQKGRVSIQFLCINGGLSLYRAIYFAD
jgi:hypothetical protein